MNSCLKLLIHKRVGLPSGTLIYRLTSISRNLAKRNVKVCILEGMNSGWELAGREKICKRSGGLVHKKLNTSPEDSFSEKKVHHILDCSSYLVQNRN